MKKRSLSTLTLCICTFFASAQAETDIEPPKFRNSSVYLELGGSSLIYSLNFEHSIPINERTRFNVGVGASYFRFEFFGTGEILSFPINATFLLGGGRHKFETGFGASHGFSNDPDQLNFEPLYFGTPNIVAGYRYENEDGFLFRAAISGMALITIEESGLDGMVIPYPKLSFGYCW